MKFLFIGGPADGQWRMVPEGHQSWRIVHLPERIVHLPEPVRFWEWPEAEIHSYTPHWIVAPGWHVPLTLYVHERMPYPPVVSTGTLMPGWVEGLPPDAWEVGPPIDHQGPWNSVRALRDAVRRENARRLAR